MRIATVMLAIGCCMSAADAQTVETTIQLPDSMSGLSYISSLVFHGPNNTVYVGGGSALVAVDARTYQKLAKITFPGSFHIMCSSTTSNKVYCASHNQRSVWVIDCATNSLLATVAVDSGPQDMCYATAVNRVYVACPSANTVKVIDCNTDSVIATIGPLPAASALCYNPGLNRVYSAQSASDEVAVIDCTTDTVIRTIWVRGVWPAGICYDSATNCVYTANQTSGTSSVIDCAGDSLVRVVTVGDWPSKIAAGPEGKVYCGCNDSVVTIIEPGGVHSIPLGGKLTGISSDPANNKVYCATSDSEIVVVDAIGDTVLTRVMAGEGLGFVCYDPVGHSTWAASWSRATVSMIDDATDRLTNMLSFGVFNPGALCYNPVNNHLYCLAEGYNQAGNLLVVIDGDSNRVLKMLSAGSAADSMVWNPVSNKVYFTNFADNTLAVLDCTHDSIVATIRTQADQEAMCCSDDGKVYIVNAGSGVTVVDPSGDTVRGFVPINGGCATLCYDRTDDKVYVGAWDSNSVSVIDANGDSVVATVPVAMAYQEVCWNQNHDNAYVSSLYDNRVVVIDCTSDTILRSMASWDALRRAYSDSVSDKVYFADGDGVNLRILDAATYTFYRTLNVGNAYALRDNGRVGPANRLYCTDYDGARVTVVAAYKTDSILNRIPVGSEPLALAWNPAHSRMYVSNSGSSSITVIRDTLVASVDESRLQASSHKLQATVVRGVLRLGVDSRQNTGYRAELLDAAGRMVMSLKAGANDVSKLAPGVYFVRGAQAQAQDVRRVVITN